MRKSEIKRIYGETIFERGLEYFKEGRVTSVIKFRGKLIGEVVGTDRYKTEVDLDDFGCECSCPYGRNCKHGVAVLLQYFNGEYTDGDEIMEEVEDMSREELMKIVERLISMNPENLRYLDMYPAREEGVSEKRVKALDKQIKSMLHPIKHTYADAVFVDDFAKLIRVNEDVITKEQILYVLDFLVKNCEEYGYFYDDYTDGYFGDAIFESLCDAFAKKELEDGDFERLKDLREEDDYGMLDPFFDRMVKEENARKLSDFVDYIHEFLDETSYVEFLINCGLIEKAKELIEAGKSLSEESRFRFYLRINREDAIEFAHRKGFYTSLIRYYHEIGAHDEATGLFKEVIGDKEKKKRLKEDLYLYRDVFDSIKKSKALSESETKEVLHALFGICYSLRYYALCVDVGMKLGDKEIMRRLIGKKKDYYFDAESKLKLLSHLRDEYSVEVEKELKEFAESLIEEKNNYAYEKAVECVFLLREMISKEEWEEYVKGIYEVHSRKINLWREFKKRGITLKRTKGMVEMERKRVT